MNRDNIFPLLANIRIDDVEKLELFKATIRDLRPVFPEVHFKIRGSLAALALQHLKDLKFPSLFLYQDLPVSDWASTTGKMLEDIKARSVFLYFEDHKLLASVDVLQSVLEDFEKLKLDYLCYSFFRASRLSPSNILPFDSVDTTNIVGIEITSRSLALLGRISPSYCTSSLLSIFSVRYLYSLLAQEKRRTKLYSKKFTSLLTRLFPHPGYRQVFHRLNTIFRYINVGVYIHHPSSPFNIEKLWWEFAPFADKFALGLTRRELFANYDDENGADGESLIKRGLYPFSDPPDIQSDYPRKKSVERSVNLNSGQSLDLRYYSAVGRIRTAPVVVITVKTGRIALKRSHSELFLTAGDSKALYSNSGGELVALEPAVIDLRIFDESF